MKFLTTVERIALPMMIGGALLAFIGIVVSHHAGADDGSSATGERLITIHDRGNERGIMTQASTLRQAFKEADIPVDSDDLVEPALDDTLTASNYEVNIYRARPVTIVEGESRQKIMTPYQTPAQIAHHAGISLHAEDKTAITRIDDTISRGAGLELRIARATEFTFTLYGKTHQARTTSATVGAMLREKGVTLGPNDGVSVPGETPMTADMTVVVWRNGVQTMTQEETIAMPVRQIKDMNKDVGFKEVQTKGEPGKRQVTYEVNLQDGNEISRKEIQSVVVTPPVEQVETIGGKLPTPTNPSESQALGRQMMLDYGFGEDQWQCLYALWMRESGWRVTAGNPSSGAYGIPQALPGSKMGPGWQNDARVQIQWGLGYIKGRYQTPCGAWSAFQSKGWY